MGDEAIMTAKFTGTFMNGVVEARCYTVDIGQIDREHIMPHIRKCMYARDRNCPIHIYDEWTLVAQFMFKKRLTFVVSCGVTWSLSGCFLLASNAVQNIQQWPSSMDAVAILQG